jgi:hypothetical protein
MSGDILLLPQYAVMACTGATLPFKNMSFMSVICLWISGFTMSPEAKGSSSLLLGIKGKVNVKITL